MLKQKKAFMISFKFILSIIIGSIILMFFIFFAFKHISTQEKLASLDIINYLDLKLDILSNSQNLNTQFNLPSNYNLNFICNKILISNKKTSYSSSTEKLIASPSILKGKEIQIWTKSWFFPFKVTNFYYIANKKTNFYIESNELLKKIPKIFNAYPLTDTSKIIEKSRISDKTVLVFSSQPKNLQELLKNNIKVLHILNNKQITFYPEQKTTSYLDEETLFLAIFSSDFDKYECLKQKLINKLQKISSIYKQKSLLLGLKSKDCKFIYSQLTSSLDNLPNTLNSDQIETLNKELEYYACPKLY